MPGSQLFILDLFNLVCPPHTHTNHALQPLKVVWPRQTSDGEAVKVEAMDLGLKFEMYQFEFKVCNCQNVHTGSAFVWPYPPWNSAEPKSVVSWGLTSHVMSVWYIFNYLIVCKWTLSRNGPFAKKNDCPRNLLTCGHIMSGFGGKPVRF